MTNPKQHHFLPKFLLKGFAFDVRGIEVYTFMFRKGVQPKPVNTRNVGQERFFHGEPGESNLEHMMQVKEDGYARLVEKLRAGAMPIAPQEVADFVANLIIRTRNLRRGLVTATEELLCALDGAVSRAPQSRLRRSLKMGLKKELKESGLGQLIRGLPSAKRKLARQMVAKQLRETDARSAYTSLLVEFRSSADISGMVAKAHIGALSKAGGAPPRLVSLLSEYEWTTQKCSEPTWILGDVGCVAKRKGIEQLCNPAMNLADVEVLMLPISATVLLTGRRSDAGLDLTPDLFNVAAAELSESFFVSAQNTERQCLYAQRIGDRFELISAEELRQIADECF